VAVVLDHCEDRGLGVPFLVIEGFGEARLEPLDSRDPRAAPAELDGKTLVLISLVVDPPCDRHRERYDLGQSFSESLLADLGEPVEREQCVGLMPRALEELAQIPESLDPWPQRGGEVDWEVIEADRRHRVR
jgi:hypothetical protein